LTNCSLWNWLRPPSNLFSGQTKGFLSLRFKKFTPNSWQAQAHTLADWSSSRDPFHLRSWIWIVAVLYKTHHMRDYIFLSAGPHRWCEWLTSLDFVQPTHWCHKKRLIPRRWVSLFVGIPTTTVWNATMDEKLINKKPYFILGETDIKYV